MGRYWDSRNHAEYYHVAIDWLSHLQGKRVLDIGCGDTPIVLWGDFEWRYAMDTGNFSSWFPPTVSFIQEDFTTFDFNGVIYDCIICLQVLEHIQDIQDIINKIISNCDVCILSLPHMWKPDPVHYHNFISVEQFLAYINLKPEKFVITKCNRMIGLWRPNASHLRNS